MAVEPMIGEVMMFAGNFAPRGWALCNGQLMSISQNTALFSLLGTNYGGNGTTTFALPNLQGHAAAHQGQGPGLSPYGVGEEFGVNNVTLITGEMAAHTHNLMARNDPAELQAPDSDRVLARSTAGFGYTTGSPNVNLNTQVVSVTGGAQPHPNQQPLVVMSFIIALLGIYPPRS